MCLVIYHHCHIQSAHISSFKDFQPTYTCVKMLKLSYEIESWKWVKYENVEYKILPVMLIILYLKLKYP